MPKKAPPPKAAKPPRVRIPTSFTIMGKTITVLAVPDLWHANGVNIGEWQPLDQRILLQEDTPQMRRHRQHKEQTFCHELAHVILEGTGRDDLSKDEKLVDTMGSLLHQFLQSQQGDLAI